MIALTITWPGGEHPFRLALAQLEGIQQKTDCGPEFLLLKLQSGTWLATELFEILRFGLIGGGATDADAKSLVSNAFDRHPLISFKVPALNVMMAALYGPQDDRVGEDTLAGETTQNSAETDAGSSAPSTD